MDYDRQVLSEVIEILANTDMNIIKKIPNSFMDFLYNNMDKKYKSNIDFSKDNWDDYVHEDTKAIIALIYRDYVVSKEERKNLIKEAKAEELKKEQELRKKYNPDNIFKNRKTESQTIESVVALEEYKESIFTKIKNWFKRTF